MSFPFQFNYEYDLDSENKNKYIWDARDAPIFILQIFLFLNVIPSLSYSFFFIFCIGPIIKNV